MGAPRSGRRRGRKELIELALLICAFLLSLHLSRLLCFYAVLSTVPNSGEAFLSLYTVPSDGTCLGIHDGVLLGHVLLGC